MIAITKNSPKWTTSKPVRAVVRIRPLLGREPAIAPDLLIINKDDHTELSFMSSNSSCSLFKFDQCFGPSATQDDIFTMVSPMVDHVLSGISATIFAYGITSSGKTFTIEGTPDKPGIVHNAAKLIYNRISQSNHKIELYLAMFEIYNEKLHNLIADRYTIPSSCLIHRIRTQLVTGTCKEYRDIRLRPLSTYKEFLVHYRNGTRKRSVGVTNHNENSSRSHLVVQFVLVWEDAANSITYAKLNLVDLAGSENNKHSGNVGARMKESKAINASLFALDQVVTALNNGSQHIPYKNSKLTTILKDALGGSSQALIVANISPSPLCARETRNTLNFATKTTRIVNRPVTNTVCPAVVCPQRKRTSTSDAEVNKRHCPESRPRSTSDLARDCRDQELKVKSWANQVFDARIKQWVQNAEPPPRPCVMLGTRRPTPDSKQRNKSRIHIDKSPGDDDDHVYTNPLAAIHTARRAIQDDSSGDEGGTPRTRLLERARKLVQSHPPSTPSKDAWLHSTTKPPNTPPGAASRKSRGSNNSALSPMTPRSKQVLLNLVNSTDQTQIASLSLGKGRAKVIAEHVTLHGPIHTPRQLLDVYGVAKKTVRAMRDRAVDLARADS